MIPRQLFAAGGESRMREIRIYMRTVSFQKDAKRRR